MTFATVQVDLVVVTCWCGTPHAVPRELREKQQRDHRNGRRQQEIFCPLGHKYVIAGEGESERLKRQLDQERKWAAREQQRHDQTKAELEATKRSCSAIKGTVTKLKKRAAAGVCPCCNRTFVNLANHMKSQHPGFATEEQSEK